MAKPFYSRLFRKEIKPNDPEYKKRVYAEALYLYFELVEKKCTCAVCKGKKEDLYEYLKKNIYS